MWVEGFCGEVDDLAVSDDVGGDGVGVRCGDGGEEHFVFSEGFSG